LNRRFLPYNGAFGDAQLEWLRGELRASKSRRQRAIVCTHVPIGVGSCQDVTLNWDFDACIAVLHDKEFRCAHDETRSLVVAVLAGHDHDGGSIVDEAGILHKTLVSPLICKPSETAFVRAELYADRLELIGIGIEKSHTIPL
jgi:manganese-dependent ADP-ribose/CDP-alcohol diphosphatase